MINQELEVTARGLPADLWRPLLSSRPEPVLPAVGHVTVVAPHPDDETLGAGGLLHRLGQGGAVVAAVFVTDGAAGYPGSTATQARELTAVRQAEARAALRALDLPDALAFFLDVPDGSVSGTEVELAQRLAPFFAAGGAGGLVLAPWPEDPHPDHQAVARAALVAARLTGALLWQYPIWMRHSIAPEDPIVDVDRLQVLHLTESEQSAKDAALRTHASQLRSPLPGYGPVLPEHVLELFADGLEPFFLPVPPADTDRSQR